MLLAAALRKPYLDETVPTQGVHWDVFSAARLATSAKTPLSTQPADLPGLIRLARAFQLAVMQERQAGRYLPFEAALRERGARGMEATVRAARPGSSTVEEWYVKTLGDVLQREVEKQYALREGRSFHDLLSGHNAAQSRVARWLQLPRLAFAPDVAESAMEWNMHNMADLNEAFTLYLPARMLDAYVRIQAHFHSRFMWTGPVRCLHVDVVSGICYALPVSGLSVCPKHKAGIY